MNFLRLLERRGASGASVIPQADHEGNTLVAQALPTHAEITRKGNGWQVMSTTGVAGKVARPTTVALGTLWNGESPGGKSYYIDRAFAHNLVSTAVLGYYSIWLCVHPVGQVALTGDITAFASLSGKSSYGGNAMFDVDETVDDDGWFPWGNWGEASATGVVPGAAVEAPVNGRIVLPPTAALSIQLVASLVGYTYTVGFGWYEE